jgi:hypothetical protein
MASRPCTEQKYVNEPAVVNSRSNLPLDWTGPLGPPTSKITEWTFDPYHCHVTVAVPDDRRTVTLEGLKKSSCTETAAFAGGVPVPGLSGGSEGPAGGE